MCYGRPISNPYIWVGSKIVNIPVECLKAVTSFFEIPKKSWICLFDADGKSSKTYSSKMVGLNVIYNGTIDTKSPTKKQQRQETKFISYNHDYSCYNLNIPNLEVGEITH